MRLQLFSDTCFERTSEDSLLECANTGLDRESKMRYQIPFQTIVETWNTPKTMTGYTFELIYLKWTNWLKDFKRTLHLIFQEIEWEKQAIYKQNKMRDQYSKTDLRVNEGCEYVLQADRVPCKWVKR